MAHTTIPKTIDEAKLALDGLAGLLTAKEWERAAIVYAFTRDGVNQYDDQSRSSSTTALTPREFAALGIKGLRSDTTVRDYRKAWQTAMDDGQAKHVEPGDRVDLPTREWPPNPKQHTPTESESVAGFRSLLERDPETAIQKVVQGRPELVPQVVKAVFSHPPVLDRVQVPHLPPRPDIRDVLPAGRPELDYSARLRAGTNAIIDVLAARRDGRWHPDPMETTLLRFLHQAVAELVDGESSGASGYSVINEIEAFLASSR